MTTALTLAAAVAAILPGWYATSGHHAEHAGCAFLRREDGARFYVSLCGDRAMVRPVYPRRLDGTKVRPDGPDLPVPPDARRVAGEVARALPEYLRLRAEACRSRESTDLPRQEPVGGGLQLSERQPLNVVRVRTC